MIKLLNINLLIIQSITKDNSPKIDLSIPNSKRKGKIIKINIL